MLVEGLLDSDGEGLALDDMLTVGDSDGDGEVLAVGADELALGDTLAGSDAKAETAAGLGDSDGDGEVLAIVSSITFSVQLPLRGCISSMGASAKVSVVASYVVTDTTITSARLALMVVAKVDRRLSPSVHNDEFVLDEISMLDGVRLGVKLVSTMAEDDKQSVHDCGNSVMTSRPLLPGRPAPSPALNGVRLKFPNATSATETHEREPV